MEMYAAIVYVIADEVLRVFKVKDDPQAKMSTAEVITFAIIAAKYFHGDYKFTRHLCKKLGFFNKILSDSRLNRRIHSIDWTYWEAIFRFLSLLSKSEEASHYAVDSFPVSYCQKNRIDKRKHFLKTNYIGFAPSKKRYFCGIKVHMVVTNKGRPIKVYFKPAAENDLNVLWTMELDIPPHSILYADGAYNCFDLEDVLKDEGINLYAKRGSKAKNRLRSSEEEKQISSKRQIIETAFSSILNLFPRYIRCRTERGFLIKVFGFIIAYCISFF